jgi:putative DNA primase/helicase
MLKSKKSIKSNIEKKHIDKKKTKNKLKQKDQAAAVLKVIRPVLDVDTGASYYRVKFRDIDGKSHVIDIGREEFARPSQVAKQLMAMHADLPSDAEDQAACVRDAVANRNKTMPTLKVTGQVGWTDDATPSFVYFRGTYGPDHDILKYRAPQMANPALGMKAGTIKAWKDGIKKACEKSDFLIFAPGIAAAGPLFPMIGMEPAVYHFQGAPKPANPDPAKKYQSSSGKTLAARLAVSMIGRCIPPDLFTLDITQTALEEMCHSCNHLLAVLDEAGRAGDTGATKTIDLKRLPYLLVSGRGKQRSKFAVAGGTLRNLNWLVPAITTGEQPLDLPGGKPRKEGEEVRMVPIAVPATWQGGIFNHLSELSQKAADERKTLAEEVEQTIKNNYGKVMPMYLKRLVKDREELLAEIPSMVDQFIASVGANGGNNWEQRYAKKFGIVLVGARLLSRYGLAPWTEDRAIAAVTNVYNLSRSSFVSIPKATDALLESLRKHLAEGIRFPKLAKGEVPNNPEKKPWGALKEIDGEAGVLVIKPDKFKDLVQPSAAADGVLHELDKRGMLVKGEDGQLKRQLLIKGLSKQRLRYVCVTGLVANKAKAKKKNEKKFEPRLK